MKKPKKITEIKINKEIIASLPYINFSEIYKPGKAQSLKLDIDCSNIIDGYDYPDAPGSIEVELTKEEALKLAKFIMEVYSVV